jgi:dihydrolipoamide dehydrogenase
LNIPTVVYSDIEVASIGLTENEAESQGLKYKIYKQSFKSNPKAVVSDFKDGFIKIIVDEKTHKFLGVHIIGHEASELIHQFAICRENDLTIDRISKTIYAHPTFSEAVREVSSGFLGKSFHR